MIESLVEHCAVITETVDGRVIDNTGAALVGQIVLARDHRRRRLGLIGNRIVAETTKGLTELGRIELGHCVCVCVCGALVWLKDHFTNFCFFITIYNRYTFF